MNYTQKVVAHRTKKTLTLGERVKLRGFHNGVGPGEQGTVLSSPEGPDRLVTVRFDKHPASHLLFSSRLESLDNPGNEQVDKVVLTLTLEEARYVRALIGPTSGDIGFDIYRGLNAVTEVGRTRDREKKLVADRGYVGICLNVSDFRE